MHLLKSTQFYKAWEILRIHKKVFWLTLLFDLLFIILSYVMSKISGFVSPGLFGLVKGTGGIAITVGAGYILIFILAALFVYTIFKYLILNELDSVFYKKKVADYKSLWKFFQLNVLLLVVGVAGYLALNFLLSLFPKYVILLFVMLAVYIIAILLMYSLLQLCHTMFAVKRNAWQSFKDGFRLLFKFKPWATVIFSSIVLLIIFYGAYYLLALIIKGVITQYYGYYVGLFTLLSTIVFYFINAFNRFYFYSKSR